MPNGHHLYINVSTRINVSITEVNVRKDVSLASDTERSPNVNLILAQSTLGREMAVLAL